MDYYLQALHYGATNVDTTKSMENQTTRREIRKAVTAVSAWNCPHVLSLMVRWFLALNSNVIPHPMKRLHLRAKWVSIHRYFDDNLIILAYYIRIFVKRLSVEIKVLRWTTMQIKTQSVLRRNWLNLPSSDSHVR